MKNEVKSILGYSLTESLTEATADDVIEAYRELIRVANSNESFEDLSDAILLFLDDVGHLDEQGELEKKVSEALRGFVMSDGLKDAMRSYATMGESRVYMGQVSLTESLEDIEALQDEVGREVGLARNFEEAAQGVKKMIDALGGVNEALGRYAESELIGSMIELLKSKEFVNKIKKYANSVVGE